MSRQDSETRKTLDMLQQINRDASTERLTRGQPKESAQSVQSNLVASQETKGGNRGPQASEIKVENEDYQDEFEDD